MKKLIFPLVLCGVCSVAFAADKAEQPVQPAEVKAPAQVQQSQPARTPQMTQAGQKKAFKARQKQVKKLIKQYRKASDTEKPAVKAPYAKRRIAAERANLDNWEAKLQETEQNLDAYKNKRVEDLLSGEAERKYKAAKKVWKKQLKEAKKNIR